MKKFNLFLLAILSIAILACENEVKEEKISTDVVNNIKTGSNEVKPYNAPKITFDVLEHNFGNVIEGEKIAYNFSFTNTGKSDLLISKVSTSCGCTVGKYPRKAVKPGEKGSVEVIFDTKGRKGFQKKQITVLANSNPNKTLLDITALVNAPESN